MARWLPRKCGQGLPAPGTGLTLCACGGYCWPLPRGCSESGTWGHSPRGSRVGWRSVTWDRSCGIPAASAGPATGREGTGGRCSGGETGPARRAGVRPGTDGGGHSCCSAAAGRRSGPSGRLAVRVAGGEHRGRCGVLAAGLASTLPRCPHARSPSRRCLDVAPLPEQREGFSERPVGDTIIRGEFHLCREPPGQAARINSGLHVVGYLPVRRQA